MWSRRRREGEEFETAFHELLPRAKRTAYRILGDIDAAEEAAIEALARASLEWNRKLAVWPPERRKAWVLRVTSNVAYDQIRSRIRQQRILPDDVAVDGQEPMRTLEVRHVLAEGLAGLPKRQREVLALRYFGDLSEAEIAGVLRVTTGTVKTSAHRGIEALRKSMGVELPHVD